MAPPNGLTALNAADFWTELTKGNIRFASTVEFSDVLNSLSTQNAGLSSSGIHSSGAIQTAGGISAAGNIVSNKNLMSKEGIETYGSLQIHSGNFTCAGNAIMHGNVSVAESKTLTVGNSANKTTIQNGAISAVTMNSSDSLTCNSGTVSLNNITVGGPGNQNISSVHDLGCVSVTASGNVTATNTVRGARLTTGNGVDLSGSTVSCTTVTASEKISAADVTASRKVSAADVSVNGPVNASGNVHGDTVSATGQISGGSAKITQQLSADSIKVGESLIIDGNQLSIPGLNILEGKNNKITLTGPGPHPHGAVASITLSSHSGNIACGGKITSTGEGGVTCDQLMLSNSTEGSATMTVKDLKLLKQITRLDNSWNNVIDHDYNPSTPAVIPTMVSTIVANTSAASANTHARNQAVTDATSALALNADVSGTMALALPTISTINDPLVRNLLAIIKKLDERVTALQGDVSTNAGSYSSLLSNSNATLTAIVSTATSGAWDTNSTQLIADISSNQSAIAALDVSSGAGIRANQTNIDNNFTTLTGRLATVDGSINSVNSLISGLDSSLAADISSSHTAREGLRSAITDISNNNATTTALSTEISTLNSTLTASINTANATAVSNNTKLNKLLGSAASAVRTAVEATDANGNGYLQTHLSSINSHASTIATLTTTANAAATATSVSTVSTAVSSLTSDVNDIKTILGDKFTTTYVANPANEPGQSALNTVHRTITDTADLVAALKLYLETYDHYPTGSASTTSGSASSTSGSGSSN